MIKIQVAQKMFKKAFENADSSSRVVLIPSKIKYAIKVTKDEGNDGVKIIMVNVIPPDHVDDLPVIEPNQHDDVPAIPEPVLVDPLNPLPPASESEPEDVIEVEDTVEFEDETYPASVHEVGESSTAPFLREESDGLLPGLMRRDINSLFGRKTSISRRLCGRRMAHALVEKKGKAKDEYYGKLILDLGNEVRASLEEGTDSLIKSHHKLPKIKEKNKRDDLERGSKKKPKWLHSQRRTKKQHPSPCVDYDGLFPGLMKRDIKSTIQCGRRNGWNENLAKKLSNAEEEKDECKKLKKELEEARSSNTLLRMQNERVERDLYWTRVRAHEFYREMIHRGFIIMPPKSTPLTEVDVRRMIKESADADIDAERVRHANAGNDARGSRPVRGIEGDVELRRWFE
nr:hypothetical protein [Tanacetum cinerariifolium]